MIAALLFATGGAAAQTQDNAPQAGGETIAWPVKSPAFTGGEKLTFAVSYSLGKVLNSDVIEVVFRTTNTVINDRQAFRIYANAKTLSNYKMFYDLDDTYETWLDASTLKPIKTLSRLKEGKYRFRADASYDWDNMQVHSTYRKMSSWKEDRQRTMNLESGSADALGLLYNLRSDDISGMREGEVRRFSFVLEDTVRTIAYKYLGREKKSFRKLGTFNTLKFSCSLASSSGETFPDGDEFYLWLSDDRNRVPLYIESPIKVGSVVATLRKVEGLKYPLDSKVK